jgi:hypothetical protein
MNGSGGIGVRLWRSLLSVAVAYAVAIQSLMIGIGGFSLPAEASQNGPAFELCLHDTSDAPTLPADKPDLSSCTHCVFCFAGAHHAVVGAAPAFFGRVELATVVIPWLGNERSVALIIRHTIANPRGPPVVA